jgi:DNA-binding PadR family transcriptional regulator
MNTRYALLGLLIEEPDHGYRLAQRMQTRLGSGQVRSTYVYRLLKELEVEGLIRRVAEESKGGRPRVMFEVTERGERDFGGWMRAPLELALIYEELHLKIAVSRVGDLPELVGLVRQRERDCLALQQQLEEAARRPAGEGEVGWSRSAAVLIRNAGIYNLQTMIAWLQRTATVMDRTIEEERREQRRRAARARRQRG